MAGDAGWDRDPRAGMLAAQGRPADDGRPTFLPTPKAPMPVGMKVALWLGALWVVGVVLTVLANRFVNDMSCLFDNSEECRRNATNDSTHVTLIGLVILIVLSVITIVVFELRRDKR